MKLLDGNKGEKLLDFGLGSGFFFFLVMTPQVQVTNAKLFK